MKTAKPELPNGNGHLPFPNVRPLATQNPVMRSRLVRIQDWEGLAIDAGYEPATIAALCPISLRQLERFFKLHFGKSPRAWAVELQCRRARELIERGYSNKAVVIELNFADESHLCHAFKKLYGCPPQTFAPLYGRSVAQNQECRSETKVHYGQNITTTLETRRLVEQTVFGAAR
jgi:AraC-like DNA-binding protein